MIETVYAGQNYRNKKNRQLYKVLLIGKHSETLEDVVGYLALYKCKNDIWVRPLDLFKEKFEEVK
jgi:hypothetical protein